MHNKYWVVKIFLMVCYFSRVAWCGAAHTNNTAHTGDTTLCLLGANWLQTELLSKKAAFTHRTEQQATDPLTLVGGGRWRNEDVDLSYVQY